MACSKGLLLNAVIRTIVMEGVIISTVGFRQLTTVQYRYDEFVVNIGLSNLNARFEKSALF